ncbi:hypothetical protein J4T90_33740 (plasmid) [Sinorhizobium medicae]|uniref:hypothetical protein n=1 Tax=Sinorhizobium medicae TaxID=110321 RepID=UPI001F1BB4B1|nr:hypothetical protein [Sinorhizobium medicae]
MSASSDGGIDSRRRGLDVIPYSQRMHDVLCETNLRGDLATSANSLKRSQSASAGDDEIAALLVALANNEVLQKPVAVSA